MSIATSTALAITAGVVAAGAAGSAIAKKKSADKAAKAQTKAVNKSKSLLQRELDPDKVNALARRIDEERAKRRIEFQKEIDPELAKLRQLGKEQLLAEANIPKEARQSNQLATQLFKENIEADPRMEALKGALIDRATSELQAGASLPASFQAELVRAGLNTGSQAGFKADNKTVGGTIARAIGLGGEQLKQSRQGQAVTLAGAAQDIATTRTNILASIFPKIRDLESADAAKAAANFGLADAALPESGLSGTDAANLKVASVKGQANLIGKQGDINAQKAIAQGQFTSALIGAGTSAVTSGIGIGANMGGAGGMVTNPNPGGAGYLSEFYKRGPQ